MLKATITIAATDTAGLEDALAEAKRLIDEGYTSAPLTRGEGSSFSFEISGDAETTHVR